MTSVVLTTKRLKSLLRLSLSVQLSPEKLGQSKRCSVDFRVDVIIYSWRIGGFQSIFPMRIGDIHKSDPTARIGGNICIIIGRILCQHFSRLINLLDQSRVKEGLFTLRGCGSAWSEGAHHQLVELI